MARKAKRRIHKMPPLSFVDQMIYWTAMLILCVMYIALLLGPLMLRKKIAFADEAVIAKTDNASLMWLIVPWLTFFFMTAIPWLEFYQDRKPIFGRKNFKYGPPAWPKVYPLFMKNKPYVWVSKRTVENRKKIAGILLAVLVISFIPFPWSLYGRDCLYRDGSIRQYNMFDCQVRDFSSEQIAEVEFEAYEHRAGRHSIRMIWDVQVHLTTDSGKTYTFDYSEFREDVEGMPPYWLTAMLELKSCYAPGTVTYTGVEGLYSVIDDNNLNVEEAILLHQLFAE